MAISTLKQSAGRFSKDLGAFCPKSLEETEAGLRKLTADIVETVEKCAYVAKDRFSDVRQWQSIIESKIVVKQWDQAMGHVYALIQLTKRLGEEEERERQRACIEWKSKIDEALKLQDFDCITATTEKMAATAEGIEECEKILNEVGHSFLLVLQEHAVKALRDSSLNEAMRLARLMCRIQKLPICSLEVALDKVVLEAGLLGYCDFMKNMLEDCSWGFQRKWPQTMACAYAKRGEMQKAFEVFNSLEKKEILPAGRKMIEILIENKDLPALLHFLPRLQEFRLCRENILEEAAQAAWEDNKLAELVKALRLIERSDVLIYLCQIKRPGLAKELALASKQEVVIKDVNCHILMSEAIEKFDEQAIMAACEQLDCSADVARSLYKQAFQALVGHRCFSSALKIRGHLENGPYDQIEQVEIFAEAGGFEEASLVMRMIQDDFYQDSAKRAIALKLLGVDAVRAYALYKTIQHPDVKRNMEWSIPPDLERKLEEAVRSLSK